MKCPAVCGIQIVTLGPAKHGSTRFSRRLRKPVLILVNRVIVVGSQIDPEVIEELNRWEKQCNDSQAKPKPVDAPVFGYCTDDCRECCKHNQRTDVKLEWRMLELQNKRWRFCFSPMIGVKALRAILVWPISQKPTVRARMSCRHAILARGSKEASVADRNTHSNIPSGVTAAYF